jgi:hypothetical protein
MTERERRLADLDALLLRAATERLDPEENAYLEGLLAEFPEIDPGVYERAAATVLLAALGPVEPVPQSVKARLFENSLALFGKGQA